MMPFTSPNLPMPRPLYATADAALNAARSIPPAPLLALQDVGKTFGATVAVDRVSLSVNPGTILGLIGPNGAGKTTTMRIAAGVTRPDGGYVTLTMRGRGLTPHGPHGATFRANIGFLPEGAPLWPSLTVHEFLADLAALRDVRQASQRVLDVVRLMQLQTVQHRAVGALSKGFRRRVALAAALLHDPALLLLDEPSDGLDPNQKHVLHDVIRTLAQQGKAIVISTHALDEVGVLCDRAVMIAGGRVVCDGSIAELRAQSADNSLDTLFRTLTREDLPVDPAPRTNV